MRSFNGFILYGMQFLATTRRFFVLFLAGERLAEFSEFL